jgi:glycosyltransferase involved in cell wall biosynthesis
MAQPKLRVLLDLSMAGRGFCGIAQDVRLLYKTLASCPQVEVTGLVYQPRKIASLHKFRPAHAPRGDRIENQARLLWALGGSGPVWPKFRPLRILSKAAHLAALIGARRARVDRLEVDIFWHVIWRLLFSQTLSPDDIPIVRSGNFLLSNLSDGMVFARTLSNRRPMQIDTHGFDFLIVQGPRPFRVSPGTRQIVRYHDMIPLQQPDTMANPWVIKGHHRAILQSLDSFFVCNSDPTRERLSDVYPRLREQSATIPYVLSDVYRPDPNPGQIASIVDVRRSKATGAHPRKPLTEVPRYLMAVSTLEPRKNFGGLIQAYNAARFRPRVKQELPNLKLLIVGSPGWKYEPILAAMRELVERGDLIHLEHVTADELRVLYSHAEALVYPSHAEGFGFPPLEAMQCDVPAIVSDVPEHRWVMGDAALYCSSYDTAQMADAIERLVASGESAELRAQLVARGRQRVKLYSQERCSSQWLELLHRLKQRPAAGGIAPPREIDRSLMDRAA